jgi:hypothetical protein
LEDELGLGHYIVLGLYQVKLALPIVLSRLAESEFEQQVIAQSQTPTQSLGARLTMLCKHIALEGLANNMRQQSRRCVTFRDIRSDFE